jgi:hypothetical protein
MKLRPSSKTYLITVAVALLPFIAAILINYVFLYRAGETTDIRTMAALLQDNDSIYGTGIHDLRKELKLEIIRLREPDIVALGSSRALDFRQEYFSRPFASAAQALSQIDDGIPYVQAMLDIHKPEVVIFTLDFWWFLDPAKTSPQPIELEHQPRINLTKLFKPFPLVWDGTLTLQQYFEMLLTGTIPNGTSTYRKYGLLADVRGLGTRADGSTLMGVRLDDNAFAYHKEFADIFADPARHMKNSVARRYDPGNKIQQERIDTYKEIVGLLHRNGVQVVAVMPPIAPPIYGLMDPYNGYGHIRELPARIASISDEFYDFQNPASIGTEACEFADVHHSGETAYMRILLTILRKNPDSLLRDYVAAGRLREWVQTFKGLTIADMNGSLRAQERDFLRLGCPRKKPEEKRRDDSDQKHP